MSFPSEKPACPSKRASSAIRTESGRCQTQRGCKGCWDAKHPDRDWPSCENASMASQPLWKAWTIPRPLCARQNHVRQGGRSDDRWRQAPLQALVAQELHASTPMGSAAGEAPEKGSNTNLERMQQHTHLARPGRRTAIPLTLLAQFTGTTPADAGSIHQEQAPVDFSTLFLDTKPPFWLDCAGSHLFGARHRGPRSDPPPCGAPSAGA